MLVARKTTNQTCLGHLEIEKPRKARGLDTKELLHLLVGIKGEGRIIAAQRLKPSRSGRKRRGCSVRRIRVGICIPPGPKGLP